jgi:hypothetical protein
MVSINQERCRLLRQLDLAPFAGNDEIDTTAAALAADEPPVLVGDGHLGTVALGHLCRVGLDLAPALEAQTISRTCAAAALPKVIGGPRCICSPTTPAAPMRRHQARPQRRQRYRLRHGWVELGENRFQWVEARRERKARVFERVAQQRDQRALLFVRKIELLSHRSDSTAITA